MTTTLRKRFRAASRAAVATLGMAMFAHPGAACEAYGPYACGQNGVAWDFGQLADLLSPLRDLDSRHFYDMRGRCYHYAGYEVYEIPCRPYSPY